MPSATKKTNQHQVMRDIVQALKIGQIVKLVSVTLAVCMNASSRAAFMDFVVVNDPGNAADTRPVSYGSDTSYLGGVADLYRIGKYEVTNSQYAMFLNAVADSDSHGLYNPKMGDSSYGTYPNLLRGGITRSGAVGNFEYSAIVGRENLPVNWVSWNSAARFANWMHNGRLNNPGTTEYGAYDFQGSLSPLAHEDDGKYWIPTVDEWYKAAYYKGGSTNAGYWTYATQSNTAPAPGPLNNAVNKANYQADNFDFGEGVDYGDMTPVGNYTLSPGPYGTFDQAGNVYEWNETISPVSSSSRTRYGGAWRWNESEQLRYDARSGSLASAGRFDTGFRLASSLDVSPTKLVQFGYDNPDTKYMRDNIEYMKTFPFHGTVFGAKPVGGTLHEFSHQSWGNVQYARPQMQHAVDELQATDFGEFTENYLRMNVTPGDVDWVFGDFSAVRQNFATAGWIVQQGGAKGIALDFEPYGSPLWHYPSQAHASTHSFEAYQLSAKEQGREIMLSIQAEAPNITIFLPFAYSYVWGPSQLNGNLGGLSSIEYGLMPSFLDGMIEAAGEGVQFVDGTEFSYRFKTVEEFQAARTRAIVETLPIVADPAKYLEKFGFGFGLWMDVDWRTGGWHAAPNQFDQNWFTPEEFEAALKNAFLVGDEFAWVYTESLTWWNANGGDPMPQAYYDAVANAFAASSQYPMLVGDYNNDGTVNSADYVVWRDSLGTNNALPNDPIGGTVNSAQYDQWRANFGKTTGSGGLSGVQAGVPEPGSILLFVMGLTGLLPYLWHRPR